MAGKRISDLDYIQRSHFAWRLDHKTAMGLLTACAYARGEHGDLEIAEVFKIAGKSEHSAKIHAAKVLSYSLEQAKAKIAHDAVAIAAAEEFETEADSCRVR